ncbi:MAG: hypothetical protein A2030_11120 [Chloroflexi bacterium RBG_19FT_COMBO_50_10]|nr:MAG: hypothetical protein A2Y53_02685 [Chloroflexi bacterium RBG_16_47_49]OGO64701.1 MAG: hypothetical protein A2030_11120 [Chloroflexi bacterium RBG_19FT_COMBO_50_10]
MELLLSPQAWLGALLIFALRVGDMSLDTLRVLFVMRGKKRISWVLGFVQSTIFVLAIGKVLTQLNNPLNIIGYAAGFATGNVVGMIIEERIAIGHILVNIISPRRGSAIVAHLRQNGYAVTEFSGRGKDGMVSMINCSVLRKQVDAIHDLVNEIDPEAFITAEDVRPIRHGFWRA